MRLLALVLLFLSACSTPRAVAPNANSSIISANAFKAHVEFLASDLLEGREAATRGYDLAAAYVASQFQLVGLQPAGTDNSYYQEVPLRAVWREPDTIKMVTSDGQEQRELKFKRDFLISGGPNRDLSQVRGETVFVGFGIDAPNRDHNDYAGLDVEGKIVVVLSGFPSGWPSEEGAYYSSGANKYKTAQKYGAVGVLSVYTDSLEKRAPWERITRNTERMGLYWVNQDGVPHTSAPGIKIGGLMSPEASSIFFKDTPKTYEEIRQLAKHGVPTGFPLSLTVEMTAGNRYEDKVSANVAGVVKGTDPKLRDEYVVITAHLDHLGIGSPVNGDAIYNGALDNAGGVAAMIEAARALASDPPRRSVMFLAVTAEEKGLLGAEYFTMNPTVPIDSIVANVNLDMPVLTYEFTNVIGFGASHSSLEGSMRDALESMNLGLAPDPFPQQAIFVRSDHYRFVQQGIPSIMLATGTDSSEGEGKGLEALTSFLGSHYHQPSDDLNRPINYQQGARFAEVNYRILKRIANDTEKPSWNDYDFFGELFTK